MYSGFYPNLTSAELTVTRKIMVHVFSEKIFKSLWIENQRGYSGSGNDHLDNTIYIYIIII